MDDSRKEELLGRVKPFRGIFLDSVKEYGNKVAIQIRKDGKFEKISYNQLCEKATGLAKMLVKLGVKKGDKVSVISKNRPEWAISYIAIHMAGGIVVPLDPLLKEGELYNIIEKAKVKMVICSDNYIYMMDGIKNKLDTLERIISMDDSEEINIYTLIEVGAELDIDIGKIPISVDDLMVILFTSGTTGKSKGVMLSNKNIIFDIVSACDVVRFTSDDTFISILPLHHVFEATVGFIGAIYKGSTITYARSYRPNEIIEDIKDSKATIMLGVPLLFEKIALGILKAFDSQPIGVKAVLKSAFGAVGFFKNTVGVNFGETVFSSLREKSGLNTLRIMLSGGAALKPWVADVFERFGFPILQGYGLSEAAPVTNVNPLDNPKNRSIGPALPGMEMKINNPNSDGLGEILVKGPNVMMGYYEDETKTEKILKDGWLYTGDMGYIDSDGYFYIKGRQKNIIVTEAGKNIYPEEIENELMKSPYIKEVVVMSKINERTGREEVHAVIHPDLEQIPFYEGKEGKEVANEAIDEIGKIIKDEVKKLTDNLASYKNVKSVSLQLKEFEKTTTKKIKRHVFNKNKK
ncbi:MAG: AMP-binding protein [Proteobacteria bacterium]|nr:AMP-binding protein [Pseudomonadota bacterium]